jgi:hypothetical protein
MTADRKIHVIANLTGAPGNPLLKRALAAYRKASRNPLSTRKPTEPSGASAAFTLADEVYVALGLPDRLWVYKLTGASSQLRPQDTWPPEIDARYRRSAAPGNGLGLE